ncbi:YecA family protein [Geomicrobium sp. JSM 1781026]|uniref:YecA family protein n=1 Tax=Geomicrobium sp. JSM 1781026 TaxID=3344580 RepID=UPI0035C0A3B4
MIIEHVGRNEPCPCGSGKKYKKCHGKEPAMPIAQTVNENLKSLQEEFLQQTMKKDAKRIDRVIRSVYDLDKLDRQGRDFAYFFSGLWVITKHPFEGHTMMERFVKHKQKSIWRPSVEESFKRWPSVGPSVYRVLEAESKDLIFVEDLFSNERRQLILNPEERSEDRAPERGEILLAVLLPAGDSYQSLAAPLHLLGTVAKDREQLIIEAFEASDQSETFMDDHFMHVLMLSLYGKKEEQTSETRTERYDSKEQQVVANGYNSYIEAHGKPEYKEVGELLWQRYTERENPRIQKPESYAAALTYLIETNIAGEKVTKKSIAEHFSISTSTLSNRHKQMVSVLEEDIQEVNTALEQLEATESV